MNWSRHKDAKHRYWQANWRRTNPDKYEAHLAVQWAVKAGEPDKGTCEVCGLEAADAHHDQYEEPLRVRWFGRRHHTRLHPCGKDMFPIRGPVTCGIDAIRAEQVTIPQPWSDSLGTDRGAADVDFRFFWENLLAIWCYDSR